MRRGAVVWESHSFPQEKSRDPEGLRLGLAWCPAYIAALPTARPGGQGNIKTLGDAYEFTVDMRDFSPEDIIVTTFNNHIEVRAEKVSLAPGPPQGPHLCSCTLPGLAWSLGPTFPLSL